MSWSTTSSDNYFSVLPCPGIWLLEIFSFQTRIGPKSLTLVWLVMLHAGWKIPIKWTAPEAIEDGVSWLKDARLSEREGSLCCVCVGRGEEE